MASRLRDRSRFGGSSVYQVAKNAAIAAARRNNASLWFAGAPADLAGFTFQDSAGTTPATGTDPIGLLLDRAAAPLGRQELFNGDFANNVDGWQPNGSANIAWSAGRAEITITGPTGGIRKNQALNLTVGKKYILTLTATAGTYTGSLQIIITGNVIVVTPSLTAAPQVLSTIFTATTVDPPTFSFNRNITVSGTWYADDISVRELPGFPATQATAANKPTLSPNSAGYLDMSFDVTNDTLSAALASGGSPAVVSFTDTGEVTGFVSATTSGFVIGNPTVGGRKVGVIVASASALPAADLAAIRAFAGVVRGTPYP